LQAAQTSAQAKARNTHAFFANALRVTQIHFGEAISSQKLFLFAPLTLRYKQRCSHFLLRTFCLDAKSTKKIKAQRCFRPHANTPPRLWAGPARSHLSTIWFNLQK